MISLFRKRQQEGSAEEGSHPVSGEASTILVVDDSPTEIHVLRKILEKEGFNVEVAANGEEGVTLAKSLMPDLILMDVVMPVLNGFQATRQLSNDSATSEIPVIMVTTKDQETDKSWAKRQGAADYLVKPVTPADLLSKVRSALSG